MSKAAHYADSHEFRVEQAKARIAHALATNTSRGDATSSKRLAEYTGLKATTVRDLVKEVRTEWNLPIVSCSQGYYLIQSVDELERELGRIDDEIETKEETKQELTQAYNIHNAR